VRGTGRFHWTCRDVANTARLQIELVIEPVGHALHLDAFSVPARAFNGFSLLR
jgi:hypothetical protein